MAVHDAADLARALTGDGDDDVTLDDSDLLVRGRRFARTTSRGLLVHLPAARSADLVARGLVESDVPSDDGRGEWVLVPDRENWHELASEARDFVGEPPVGHDS